MRRLFVLTLLCLVGALPVRAQQIMELTSPSGVPFWLVPSKGIPLVQVRVAFRAGSVYDPQGKEGLAALTASLLNESSSRMDAKTFAEHMQALGMHLRIFTGDDVAGITMLTLADTRDGAFDALGDVLGRPAFTRDDTRRLREAMLSTIRKEEANPSARAGRELRQRVFAGHPYGRPATGHTATVSKLTAADAQGFHRRHYTRANMTVSLVGDLTPEQAGALVDRAARHLPQGRALPPLAKAAPPFPQVFFVERNIPQTYLRMGHAGVDRRDPDFAAIQVMNYILGGGGFTSRLMQKIRTEEGLVYFVRSHFHPYHRGGMFEVEAQTRNETARRVVDLVRDQIRRLRAFGVEADEFQTAKDFLLGFHPLRTATTADLLSWMTILQMEGLGADYLNTWPERIRAVTREDVFRVANRLLDPAKLVVVSVGGKPAEGSQKAAE